MSKFGLVGRSHGREARNVAEAANEDCSALVLNDGQVVERHKDKSYAMSPVISTDENPCSLSKAPPARAVANDLSKRILVLSKELHETSHVVADSNFGRRSFEALPA